MARSSGSREELLMDVARTIGGTLGTIAGKASKVAKSARVRKVRAQVKSLKAKGKRVEKAARRKLSSVGARKKGRAKGRK